MLETLGANDAAAEVDRFPDTEAAWDEARDRAIKPCRDATKALGNEARKPYSRAMRRLTKGRVPEPLPDAPQTAPLFEAPVLTYTISRTIRSRFPFPRQEGTRGRWGPIGKRSRRPGGPPGGVPPTMYAGGAPAAPEGAGNATRRAVLRGHRTSSRAACDAPASRRAALLAGNLARPSYGARNRESKY